MTTEQEWQPVEGGFTEEEWQQLLDQYAEFLGDDSDEQWPVTDEHIATALEGAAAWLRVHNWIQQRPFFEGPNGEQFACFNGALYRACGFTEAGPDRVPFSGFAGLEGEWRVRLWTDCLDVMRKHLGEESYAWNDSIGQTKGRVIDTVERLARKIRREAGERRLNV